MTTTAPRFAGLQKALAKISARTADEKQRMRAAANGEVFAGRLGTTKSRSADPAPRPQVKASVAAAPRAATSAPPKPLARAEIVALAVRTDPKLKGMADIALHMIDDPDLKGLSGDGIVRCMQGIDAAAYRATMAEEKRKASIAHADAVWSRARASIEGSGTTTTAPAATINPAAQGRKLSAADARADAVWDRARASIDGSRPAAATDRKPAAGARSGSADDIWARAYAAVAR